MTSGIEPALPVSVRSGKIRRTVAMDVDWVVRQTPCEHPFCEVAKATQNALYALEKLACEVSRLPSRLLAKFKKALTLPSLY